MYSFKTHMDQDTCTYNGYQVPFHQNISPIIDQCQGQECRIVQKS